MSEKLEKIGIEREKARVKRDEWDARYKELDRKYHEQENCEIHEMVHAANLSPEQLARIIAFASKGIMNAPVFEEREESDGNED